MNYIANNFSNISFSHLSRGFIVRLVCLLLCVNLNCRFAPISGSYLYSKLPIGALIILILQEIKRRRLFCFLLERMIRKGAKKKEKTKHLIIHHVAQLILRRVLCLTQNLEQPCYPLRNQRFLAPAH